MSLIPRELLTFPLSKKAPTGEGRVEKEKPPRGFRKPRKQSAASKREGMSEAYLVAIRQLPCCTCGAPAPSEAHHLKRGTGERGLGLRSTDKWAIPHCRECHHEIESVGSQNEPAWYRGHGVDAFALSARLWEAFAASDPLPKMRSLVAVHEIVNEVAS